jgi:K+-transporting ATPase ATPase C chain
MKLLIQSIRHTLFWTLLCGLAYPAIMTLVAQLAFPRSANGSLVKRDGNIIGSALLAQQFTGSNYFWPRPSGCTYGTGPAGLVPSGASNLGPTSGALQTNVQNNAAAFIAGNSLPTNTTVPGDMLFASGSGLDPDISPEAAQLQIARVAAARGVSAEKLAPLVEKFTQGSQWGFLGEPRVNVLLLNIALDEMCPKKPAPAT